MYSVAPVAKEVKTGTLGNSAWLWIKVQAPMHNLPMFTFQSKHYCQIIADDCGRQVEGVGIKSHEILGHGFTKYGTVIDTMALHKKIPASIKNFVTA